jgi:hypothetical protein
VTDLYRPVCGDTGPHREHLHWHGLDRSLAVTCQGYTAGQAGITAMVTLIETMIKEGQVPAGAWLEMGPAVMSELRRMVTPDFTDLMTGTPEYQVGRRDMEARVVRTAGSHGWRLVIASGDIGDDDHGT